MRPRSFFINLSILLGFCTGTVQAATTASDISAAIEAFMAQYKQKIAQRYLDASRLEHHISALDSRISMHQCDQPLAIEKRDNSEIGRINLKVSCASPKSWTLYVPTELKVYHPVVVASGPIYKSVKLQEHHLDLKETDISRIRGSYYFYLEDVLNMETKRQLKPGAIITSGNLRPPLVIEKGDAVVLTATLGSLTVKTPAIALSKGRRGQQIKVQNRQSKKVVSARVLGPGAVKATL